MKCEQCGQTMSQEEADRVADSFYFDFDVCLPCAEELWHENEREQIANNPIVQDGPAA